MKRKCNGLTLEQHRQAGAQLKQLGGALSRLCYDLGKAYGVNSKARAHVDRALDHLAKLRCELENQLYRDVGEDRFDIYYGPTVPWDSNSVDLDAVLLSGCLISAVTADSIEIRDDLGRVMRFRREAS